MNPVKISISINQAQVVTLGLELDLIDLALFDYCQSYLLSSKSNKTLVEGKIYVQVRPEHIIADMPLLGLTTTKSINNHIDALIGAGLLERCPENQKLRGTYICAGYRYDEYIGIKEGEVVEKRMETPAPTVQKKPYEFEGLALPHNTERFIEWLDKLAQEPLWKKKSKQAWTMAFNALKKVAEPIACTAIAISIDRQYRGVFPESVRREEINKYLNGNYYGRSDRQTPTCAPVPKKVDIEDIM